VTVNPLVDAMRRGSQRKAAFVATAAAITVLAVGSAAFAAAQWFEGAGLSPAGEPLPDASTPQVPKEDPPPDVSGEPPARPVCAVDEAVCDGIERLEEDLNAGRLDDLLGSASEIAGVECGRDLVALLPACQGMGAGQLAEGFNFAADGKQAQLLDRAAFVERVTSALARDGNPARGTRSFAVVSAGCLQPDRDAPANCADGFAVALRVAYRDRADNVVALFFHPPAAGRASALFGLYVGAPSAMEWGMAGLLGHRRFAGVFPGGEVGAGYYFEPWEARRP
jgi:hypothetical protein